MTKNKTGRWNAVLLLVITILISFSGVFGRKVVEELRGTGTDVEFEREIAALMKQSSGQRRRSLTYNAILARIARERAYDMGTRNYFGHVNPEGIGPNYLVTQAGYVLPDFYGKERSANNIESIVVGSKTAQDAWARWMDSTGHRAHLLGLSEIYADQIDYGVGHAFVPGSRYQHYWVVITAEPGDRNSSAASSKTKTSASSNVCAGSASPYPHVIETAGGKLKPACGYVWVNDDDPKDRRVKLMPGLIRTRDGNLLPATGYRWVRPEDSEDLRVEPIP